MPISPAGNLTQYRTQIDQNETDIATLDAQLSGAIVTTEEVFRASSLVTQEPVAVDTPIQITFGANQSNAYFNLDALGNLTVLQAGNYNVFVRFVFGRTGAPGIAELFIRALLNGTQSLSSLHSRLDDGNTVVSSLFNASVTLPASAVATFELLRSSNGVNAGGIFAEPSPLAGWSAAPSAVLVVTRNVLTLGS